MDIAAILDRAFAAREALLTGDGEPLTDLFRLLDGRAEGLPGWTIDRCGAAVLIQCYEPEGADPELLAALIGACSERLGVGLPIFLKERSGRLRSEPRRAIGRQVAGEPLPVLSEEGALTPRPGRVLCHEDGWRYGLDLLHGSNTGLFADARPMRRWVRQHSEGRRLLNLFSYTSGFGVAAAAGGARSVSNVDVVPSALVRGAENFALNDLPCDPRSHQRADVFDYLKRAERRDQRWDAIVLDPPPVSTPRRKGRGKGRGRGFQIASDYGPLVERCLRRLSEGGWLLCLSAMRGTEHFEDALPQAATEQIARGDDFPGAPEQGLRAWVLRT